MVGNIACYFVQCSLSRTTQKTQKVLLFRKFFRDLREYIWLTKLSLKKIDRAAEYFERYFEFEDAVTVSKENKEYLKTYIHDNDYVVKNFNIKIK